MAESDLTRLLHAWGAGEEAAGERLVELIYPQLEALARNALRHERSGFTLQTGDLVNEAFLRLHTGARVDWRDRGHFFALASRMLRRIVVDHCRRRGRRKRGDGAVRVEIDEALDAAPTGGLDPAVLIALDDALAELEAVDAAVARVVELRFFVGLDYDDIAQALSIGRATVFRHWRFARAWLHARLA